MEALYYILGIITGIVLSIVAIIALYLAERRNLIERVRDSLTKEQGSVVDMTPDVDLGDIKQNNEPI